MNVSPPNAQTAEQLELEGPPPEARDPVLRADLWLAARIVEHTGLREALFHGAVHEPRERRERLRKAILENGLATVGLGHYRGKFETYRAHFARRFGEPL